MEVGDRIRLLACRCSLIADLRPDSYFLGHLLQEGAIRQDDYHQLINDKSYVTDSDRIAALLDILPLRGPKAYSAFREAVGKDHYWLRDQLDQVDVSSKMETYGYLSHNKKAADPRDEEICPEAVDVLKKNTILLHRWMNLARSLGMHQAVPELRVRSSVYYMQLADCVTDLFDMWRSTYGKKATLRLLLEALRKESFNDVADELEKKYLGLTAQ